MTYRHGLSSPEFESGYEEALHDLKVFAVREAARTGNTASIDVTKDFLVHLLVDRVRESFGDWHPDVETVDWPP